MLTRRALRIQETLFSADPNKVSSFFSDHTEDTLGSLARDKKNIGHWKSEEQVLYMVFLRSNRDKFVDREIRRSEKIFREMARAIKTRGADQCRSHHQKMENKYPVFDDLLGQLSQLYGDLEEQVLQSRDGEESKNQLNLAGFSSENRIQIGNAEIPKTDLPEDKCSGPPPPVEEEILEQKFDQMSLLSFDAIHELERCVQPIPLLADTLFEQVCLISHF